MPTERGLTLFGILEKADPALVDPGVTAQFELLLDEVLVGKQQVAGAIGAICAQASRIIERLVGSAVSLAEHGPTAAPLPGILPGSGRPPSPAMRKFVESLAARLKAKPPAGYTKSAAVCRWFFDQHAPKQEEDGGSGDRAPRGPTAAQLAFAQKLAQAQGITLPEEAKASVRSLSAWIDTHRGKAGRQPATDRGRSRKSGASPRSASRAPGKAGSAAGAEGTALDIPFGNKAAAVRLGARYTGAGWVAPPGTDLDPFRERGWL